MRKIAIKTASYNLGGFSIGLIARFIAAPIVVGKLGVNLYGIYSFIVALIGFTSILEFGFSAAIVKFLSQYKDTNAKLANKTLIMGFAWLIIMGLVGSAIMFFGAAFLVKTFVKPDASAVELAVRAIKIASIGFTFGMVNSALTGVLKSYLRYDLMNIVNIIKIVVMYTAIIMSLFYGYGLIAMVSITVLVNMASMLVCFVIARRVSDVFYMDQSANYLDSGIAKTIFSFSFFIAINNLLGVAYFRIDKFIVGNILGASYIGYYSLGFLVSSMVMRINGLIFNFLFPHISNVLSTERDRMGFYFSKSIKYAVATSALLAFNISAVGNFLLIMVMGRDFYSHIPYVIPIMASLFYFSGIGIVPYHFYNAHGRPKFNLISTGIGVGLYLVGCIFLTKRYGITGTASSLIFGIIPFPIYFGIIIKSLKISQIEIWWLIMRGFVVVLIGATIGAMAPNKIAMDWCGFVVFAIVSGIISICLCLCLGVFEMPKVVMKQAICKLRTLKENFI
jgi:O-antigen/teichoic acid export membrane protein